MGSGRFTFSPFGANLPLFSLPPARASFAGLTGRINVPQPIDRVEFARSLRDPAAPQFYGASASILLIADGTPVHGSQIVSLICPTVLPVSGAQYHLVESPSIPNSAALPLLLIFLFQNPSALATRLVQRQRSVAVPMTDLLR